MAFKHYPFILTLLAFFFGVSHAAAQGAGDEEGMTWEEFVQRMSDEDDEFFDEDTRLLEHLEQLHAKPVNINAATADDLLALPFIDQQQANDIIAYREKNGALYSLGELMLIRSLSKDEREMLRLFVYAGGVDSARPSGKARQRSLNLDNDIGHEAVWRTDVPLYTRAGYEHYPDSVLLRSPNKVYLGNRFHHSLRYAVQGGKHWAAGVQAEKDAGETGIDYVSAYVMVKNLAMVKSAIVGNYRVSFGKGLAVNSGIRYGKTWMVSNSGRIDAGIAKHSSMAEDGYMTGGAATLRLGRVLVSAFASRRNADATMRNDSMGAASLKTDGLHRTRLERSKDGNMGISNVGGNVHWDNNNVGVSATIVATHLSTPLAPDHSTPSTLYRLYNAQGTDFMNGSVAYQWHKNGFALSGETAVSHANGFYNAKSNKREGEQSGMATLNTLRWRINSSNTLTAIARWYGAKYVSLNGRAFGENASVQNEEGLLVGWTGRMAKGLKVTTFADLMYFPWMKYQVSNRSHGIEGLAQMEYSPNRHTTMMLRYRIKAKEQDRSDATLGYKARHNINIQVNRALSPSITLRTSAVATLVNFDSETNTGFAIGERMRWQSNSTKSKVDLGITYFNTDNYDSRVSVYESSPLYTFSFSSFYYHGLRASLFATLPLKKDTLTITAKLASTYYFNRDHIGSGLDLIKSNHKEDLQLQLRWKI